MAGKIFIVALIVLAVYWFVSRRKDGATDYITQLKEMITGKFEITPQRRAALDTINWCEGSPAYNQTYAYHTFDNNGPHPNNPIMAGAFTSTAAGAFQFIYSTWKNVIAKLGIEDKMTPVNQDQAALQLISDRGVLPKIDQGNIQSALSGLSYEWASMPNPATNASRYIPQKSKLISDVVNYFNTRLQTLQQSV